MPAYDYDPYLYRIHKMKGGSFNNFEHKTYSELTNRVICKHLSGEQLVGVYPLLQNNCSHFIAADFDGEKWQEECKAFLETCHKKNLEAHLERSKSGNGGHVWIFFEEAYPAAQSRKIMLSLLEESGSISTFDKNSSFDRLFPNQDFLSGKGLGNLIALPLYGRALKDGNSLFLDPSLESYPDQWSFLESIRKTSIDQLDNLFKLITGRKNFVSATGNEPPKKLTVRLSDAIYISQLGMTSNIINFLKEELNFANTDYFVKKNLGHSTWETKRYFKFIEETGSEVIIPRGFVGKLLRYLGKQAIEYDFLDQRRRQEPVKFKTQFNLYPHQNVALQAASKKDFGVIVSPPGTGKTIIGLKIIADKQQPALIVVHRKQLLQQWMERIQAFLGIPKREIGSIGQGKGRVGNGITVAMIQSLGKQLEKDDIPGLHRKYGTIIVDECHHIPAKTYSSIISKLSPYYQYGLTATPFRKGSDGKAIFIHLGEIIVHVQPQDISAYKRPAIITRDTDLDVPFNSKTDTFETLSKILIHDSARNQLILKDVKRELDNGRKVILLTEKKEHIATLYQLLKQSYEIITLHGDDSAKERQVKWRELQAGNYQVLITTGQYFGEGSDLHNASCLFLAYPFSFKGKLVQYIGRVQRAEIAPTIYDYRDIKISYLNRLFMKRNVYYQSIARQASLFDDNETEILGDNKRKTWVIDKEVSIPFEKLDFHYGSVVFKIPINKEDQLLEFEVEQFEIRPEFEVLKPYFAKTLSLNRVNIKIYAEFDEGRLVAQSATSEDMQKINQEIIESVRFRFMNREIFKKLPGKRHEKNLLDLAQLQNDHSNLYSSEEDLLNECLKRSRPKHFLQLRYLATKHDRSILKIRFVLAPFSFVFLLNGLEQFHIVLETLDTEEATYAWHIDKQKLPRALKEIDQQLNIIKNKGRQAFLATQPENFSRILHDYSEERKGFVIWKGILEERLI